MNISTAPAQFRPVTITLETRDDFDKLLAIVCNVAENRVQHAPQIVKAAQELRGHLYDAENDQ